MDVHLAVDMISHGVRQNMRRASLLTGDLDFKPVVKGLIDIGIYVTLHYMRRYTSEELVWSADNTREITFQRMHGWTNRRFQRTHPIPYANIGGGLDPGGEKVRTGIFNQKPVALYKYDATDAFQIVVEGFDDDGQLLKVVGHNEPELFKYFQVMYGLVEWT